MTELQKHAEQACKSLHEAVKQALDTKRRLNQYAIIYKDGKTVRLLPEQIPPLEEL